MRRLLSLVLLVAACSGGAAEISTTPGVMEPPSTTSSSTPTSVTETIAAPAEPQTLREFQAANNMRSGLNAGTTYRAVIDGVTVLLTPPLDGWELLGYQSVGADAGALFAWKGPTGFRRETLDVFVWEVTDLDGESAWSAIAERFPTLLGDNAKWEWIAEGETNVGGVASPWREVRSPPWDEHEGWPRLSNTTNAFWLPDTSARFYLVPVGDLTVTVVGFETRCTCRVNDVTDEFSFKPADQLTDDTENELSMWLPELEAFLAAMTFEAP